MKYNEAMKVIEEAMKQWAYFAARHPRTLDLLSDCCLCDKGMTDAKATIIKVVNNLQMD